MDTEADSLHAYPEKICLIQISTPNSDRIIDPLAHVDLAPFIHALAGRELIMHGADYDLRLLRKHYAFKPTAIFDTMIAARLLGVPKFSLGDLVEHFLSVKLEKGPQKANWGLRPLTARMVVYARNDTHFLKPLSDLLKNQLEKLGRVEWHRQCCAQLIEECSLNPAPDPDHVWRVKGCHHLSRPALAILREIWRWREHEAVRANKPPFFILSHDTLSRIAELASEHSPFDALIPKSMSDRRRQALSRAIEQGRGVTPENYPKIPHTASRRSSEAGRRRYIELQKRRNVHATRLGIDPTLIASRSMLSDLAHDWERNSPALLPWQLHLLAN